MNQIKSSFALMIQRSESACAIGFDTSTVAAISANYSKGGNETLCASYECSVRFVTFLTILRSCIPSHDKLKFIGHGFVIESRAILSSLGSTNQ